MRGTVVCGVTNQAQAATATEVARAISDRLELRLVLVHVVEGVPPATEESLTARQRRQGGEKLLRELSRDAGERVEARIVVGERAEALAQVAAEEGADLIVLGSRATGLRRRRLRCALARELEAATPVPVLVAPPSTRRRSGRRLAAAETPARRTA